MFLDILKTILLGIVEGITEWLPISSTGHMILVDEFVKLSQSQAFKEMFFVVIQLGAIMAVVVLYFKKLNPFSKAKSSVQKKQTLTLWGKVLVACVPAGIIGVLFNDLIDSVFYNSYVVSLMLIIYGVLFIVLENKNKNKLPRVSSLKELTYKDAAIIGIFQVLSLIPGTSRSGATILGAILIGTSRYVAAEFSFFLAIPVMFGASFLKLLKFGFHFSPQEVIILLLGMTVAFFTSVIAIRFLMNFIKKHDFKPFGVYRIVLGLIVLLYFLIAKQAA